MKLDIVRPAILALFILGLSVWAADNTTAAEPPATTQPGATTQAAATQPTTGPSATIDWSDAKNHVGETLTVSGPVKGTHALDNASALLINIGKDYPDPGRFTIFLQGDNNTTPSDSAYVGKTVSVTGKIVLYRNVPEIRASLKDVEVK